VDLPRHLSGERRPRGRLEPVREHRRAGVKSEGRMMKCRQARRAGIFVDMKPPNESSSVRSGIVAVRKDYAAPTGLGFILVCGSTNMPRLTALGTARRRKRQPGRARSPAMSRLVAVRQHRPMAVWGGRTGQKGFESQEYANNTKIKIRG
jgi:hypothetical protein